MKKLYIKETLNSPKVLFDPTKKRYEISGKSFPENSKTFYEPVFEWISELSTTDADKMQLSLMFDYISSSSVITIKQLLSKVKALSDKGASIDVLWHYDVADPDIRDIGEEYKKLVGINIQFIEKSS
jgi:hypothetical protein